MGGPGTGIGGYDLADPADRVFAFDYDGSGKLDHLVLYRPGQGTIWILRNSAGDFTPVYHMGAPGTGIGGYDLADPADRAFAFDYDGSGKLPDPALYRPGTGTFWILKNSDGGELVLEIPQFGASIALSDVPTLNKAPTQYDLVFPQQFFPDFGLESAQPYTNKPFFYEDAQRTYFV